MIIIDSESRFSSISGLQSVSMHFSNKTLRHWSTRGFVNLTTPIREEAITETEFHCLASKGFGDMGTLCRAGRLKEALATLYSMDKQAIVADSNSYASLLQASANMKSLIYADACKVFDKRSERNIFSWTAMIGEYARRGHYEEALALFSRMETVGMWPDRFIFPCALKACAGLQALEQGVSRMHEMYLRKCVKEMWYHGMQ